MLHELLYSLHILGMAVIIAVSLFLVIRKDLMQESRKKLSLSMMSAAHTQLLTGFALFFLLLADVNHMKIGIKMLLAIEVAVFATIYYKAVAKNEQPKPFYIIIILTSAISTTLVAFLL